VVGVKFTNSDIVLCNIIVKVGTTDH